MDSKRSIRILLAKPGLDGHDRGIKVLAQGLKNEGMEVIYSGRRQKAQDIVARALDEDVDVIGISSLSGAHNQYFPRVAELLAERNRTDIMIIGGGIIPDEDVGYLLGKGITAIFGPGTHIAKIADFIRANVRDLS